MRDGSSSSGSSNSAPPRLATPSGSRTGRIATTPGLMAVGMNIPYKCWLAASERAAQTCGPLQAAAAEEGTSLGGPCFGRVAPSFWKLCGSCDPPNPLPSRRRPHRIVVPSTCHAAGAVDRRPLTVARRPSTRSCTSNQTIPNALLVVPSPPHGLRPPHCAPPMSADASERCFAP